MNPKIAEFLLTKVMGWTMDSGKAPEKKVILLGAPHTSMWDFVVSYLFYAAVGGHSKIMIKKEFFFWPLGPILRALGGIPADRKNGATTLKSTIDAFNSNETFHMAMCPEGTRKPIRKWKMGYHTIARETGAAVYVGYFDWKTRHIGIGDRFEIGENAREDTEKIQQIYEKRGVVGKHPEKFCTH